jgi:hypothetical protein
MTPPLFSAASLLRRDWTAAVCCSRGASGFCEDSLLALPRFALLNYCPTAYRLFEGKSAKGVIRRASGLNEPGLPERAVPDPGVLRPPRQSAVPPSAGQDAGRISIRGRARGAGRQPTSNGVQSSSASRSPFFFVLPAIAYLRTGAGMRLKQNPGFKWPPGVSARPAYRHPRGGGGPFERFSNFQG